MNAKSGAGASVKTGTRPETLVREPRTRELVGEYEAVLREMRTHAVASRLIAEWVKRLDFARDEYVSARTKR